MGDAIELARDLCMLRQNQEGEESSSAGGGATPPMGPTDSDEVAGIGRNRKTVYKLANKVRFFFFH